METTPPLLPPTQPAGDSNDKLLIILCHLSLLLGVGIILPLIVLLVRGKDSPAVSAHAKETLNFHISLVIYGFISGILSCFIIGYFFLFALVAAALICAILGAIKASEGGFYKYPLTIRLVS